MLSNVSNITLSDNTIPLLVTNGTLMTMTTDITDTDITCMIMGYVLAVLAVFLTLVIILGSLLIRYYYLKYTRRFYVSRVTVEPQIYRRGSVHTLQKCDE